MDDDKDDSKLENESPEPKNECWPDAVPPLYQVGVGASVPVACSYLRAQRSAQSNATAKGMNAVYRSRLPLKSNRSLAESVDNSRSNPPAFDQTSRPSSVRRRPTPGTRRPTAPTVNAANGMA